jgi:hypothetical protein
MNWQEGKDAAILKRTRSGPVEVDVIIEIPHARPRDANWTGRPCCSAPRLTMAERDPETMDNAARAQTGAAGTFRGCACVVFATEAG